MRAALPPPKEKKKKKNRAGAGAAKAAAMCKRPAAAGTSAAKAKCGRPPRQNEGRPRQVLVAKYPWGREGGPPPASEAELQSLADEMARLRRDRGNFARPERTDAVRLAHADAMLEIMRGKARAGFGGGRAMATHGLSLHRSAGVALAKRARKLAHDLEARFDPEAAPSVLIEEGITLLDAN